MPHRCMEGQKSMLNLGAVILAAGMSRRMGQPKLLLSLSGKPLFRYTVEKSDSRWIGAHCTH